MTQLLVTVGSWALPARPTWLHVFLVAAGSFTIGVFFILSVTKPRDERGP